MAQRETENNLARFNRAVDNQIKEAYCYLPRLANEDVLLNAISSGLGSYEYFAYASEFDGTRYLDLKYGQSVGMVERSAYLVKVSAAKDQLTADEAKQRAEEDEARARAAQQGQDSGSGAAVVPPQPIDGGLHVINVPLQPTPAPAIEQPKNKRFYMSVPLDTTRIGRYVQRFVEEVITHLTTADGTQVEVSLEVNVQAPRWTFSADRPHSVRKLPDAPR